MCASCSATCQCGAINGRVSGGGHHLDEYFKEVEDINDVCWYFQLLFLGLRAVESDHVADVPGQRGGASGVALVRRTGACGEEARRHLTALGKPSKERCLSCGTASTT